MEFDPKVPSSSLLFKTIDSHTMGEATRIIYEGFPDLPGASMMEKKHYVENNFDHYRQALVLEPRGHRDMFGAIFMDSGGYLNMCGHGSIGIASMVVETNLVEVKEPFTYVTIDTPSGLIKTKVHVANGKATKVSIVNVPSFLCKQDLTTTMIDYGTISYDISFGGSFFALVDADKLNLELEMDNLDEIIQLGMRLREQINQEQEICHPTLNIDKVDLIEFYGKSKQPQATLKNCVVFGNAQADRSPCGTGTSAKLAALYAKGKIGLNVPLVYESITGSLFVGKAIDETMVGANAGVIPEITGSAYITGINQWIIDDIDPLRFGFLMGNKNSGDNAFKM